MLIEDAVIGQHYQFSIVDGPSTILGKILEGKLVGTGFISGVPNRQFTQTQYVDFRTTYSVGLSDIEDEIFYFFKSGDQTYVFAKSWIVRDSVTPMTDDTILIEVKVPTMNERNFLLSTLGSTGLEYTVKQ